MSILYSVVWCTLYTYYAVPWRSPLWVRLSVYKPNQAFSAVRVHALVELSSRINILHWITNDRLCSVNYTISLYSRSIFCNTCTQHIELATFTLNSHIVLTRNAVVECDIKLFQNYFRLRRRSPEIILFQPVETSVKLFQNDFRRLLQIVNIFQHVQRRRNNFEIIS